MATITNIKAPRSINGVDVQGLETLIATVGNDPSKGMTHWRVTNSWQGQTRSRAQVESFGIGGETVKRRFSFEIDEPNELGGSNAFANPQEHLIAALNACMTVGYVALCSLEGITLEKLEIETEGDIDLRGLFALDDKVAPGYKSLNYTVRIKGDGTPEQFAKIHEMVKVTSPNYYNLSQPVPLNAELVVE